MYTSLVRGKGGVSVLKLLRRTFQATAIAALLIGPSILIRGQAPPTASGPNIQDLQRRIDLVEERNRHLEELVKATSDASRTFITVLSVIIGVIVAVQSIFQGMNLHHQWARDADRDQRDKDNEKVSNTGAKAVSDV